MTNHRNFHFPTSITFDDSFKMLLGNSLINLKWILIRKVKTLHDFTNSLVVASKFEAHHEIAQTN